MTNSPSPDAAGRDIVERLKSEAPAWAIIGPQLIQPAIDEIQSLRAQLAEKEKELDYERKRHDATGKRYLDVTQEYNECIEEIDSLTSQLEAIRKQTIELTLALRKTRISIVDAVQIGAMYNGSTYNFKPTIEVIDAALSPTTAEEESKNG